MQPPDMPDVTGAASGPLDARSLADAEGSGPDAAAPRKRTTAEHGAAMAHRSRADQRTLAEAEETATPAEDRQPRQLHPLPPGLVELYGLLAVLFVLVPEWMASGALFGFREGRRGSDLPAPSGAWKRLPELRLASLNLAELRQLAREQGLIGYSRQSRQELSSRLLRRLRTRP